MQEAGFPTGVVNIVTGLRRDRRRGTRGASRRRQDRLHRLERGRPADLSAAAGNFKKVTLELGGKSPVIVFPDADIDRASPARRGQSSSIGPGLLRGVAALRAQEGVRPSGRGHRRQGPDAQHRLGPRPEDRRWVRWSRRAARSRDRLSSTKARRTAPRVLTGGDRIGDAGYFVAPTVLADTNAGHVVRARGDLRPGPVRYVLSMTTISTASPARRTIRLRPRRPASGRATSASRTRWRARIAPGSVRINGGSLDTAVPIGGFKQSGWGREKGREGARSLHRNQVGGDGAVGCAHSVFG